MDLTQITQPARRAISVRRGRCCASRVSTHAIRAVPCELWFRFERLLVVAGPTQAYLASLAAKSAGGGAAAAAAAPAKARPAAAAKRQAPPDEEGAQLTRASSKRQRTAGGGLSRTSAKSGEAGESLSRTSARTKSQAGPVAMAAPVPPPPPPTAPPAGARLTRGSSSLKRGRSKANGGELTRTSGRTKSKR